MKFIDKKSTAIFAVAAISILLSIVFYTFVLRPQIETKIHIDKELAVQKQKYDSAMDISQPKNKKDLLEHMDKLRTHLNSFVIDADRSANLTFEISNIANKGKVESFSFKKGDSEKDFEIPDCSHIAESYIQIGFLSSFNQFAKILNTLERNQPVVFIDEFVITRSEKEDSGNSLNMNLAVFVKKQKS